MDLRGSPDFLIVLELAELDETVLWWGDAHEIS